MQQSHKKERKYNKKRIYKQQPLALYTIFFIIIINIVFFFLFLMNVNNGYRNNDPINAITRAIPIGYIFCTNKCIHHTSILYRY
jgi:hypothetical protein